jgi:uncharacterized membrane protein
MIGPWLGGAFDAGARHWRALLPPALVLVGLLVALGVVLGLALVVALPPDPITVVLWMVPAVLLFMLGFTPIWLGFVRGVLSVVRGQGWPSGALLSGLSQTPAALATMLISMVLSVGGMMLFYVPGLLISGLFLFAVPVLADERCGPIRALKRSAELVQGQLWTVALYWLLASLISGMVTQLPLLCLLISMPLQALLVCVPYVLLTEAEAAEAEQPSSST